MDAALNVPASSNARPRPRNWGFILRVSIIGGIIALLVGYAAVETYQTIVLGGVVNRGDYYDVKLKAMSSFNIDARLGTVADVPQRYRDLSGKKVQLMGEIAPGGFGVVPGFASDFRLCYSVQQCCFNGPPQPQHFVDCRLPKGKRFKALEEGGPVRVLGTLHVKVVKLEDRVHSVFQLDVDSVERAS